MKKLLQLTIPASLLLSPITLAQKVDIVTKKIHQGDVSVNDIGDIIINLTGIIASLAGSIAVIMLMYGGFQYMIGGTTNNKEAGKMTVIYAVAGLFVTFFSWWIVKIIAEWMTT